MDTQETLTQEAFAGLLGWLDSDEREAAGKYEKIRERLIKVFAGRGCNEAEFLADRTIDRVAVMVQQIAENYDGKPELYFYGVAKNVFHEWERLPKAFGGLNEATVRDVDADDAKKNLEHSCLKKCLKTLSADERDLITRYYRDKKQQRIKGRKALAERCGLSMGALQTRAHRLRGRLLECVKKCAGKK